MTKQIFHTADGRTGTILGPVENGWVLVQFSDRDTPEKIIARLITFVEEK
jgi:hypothetical protein